MEVTALEVLQRFFDIDNKIKKGMYYNVPPANNGYLDNDTICEYTDNLEDFLKHTFSELKNSSIYMFGEESFFMDKLEELEKSCYDSFYSCGFDIVKLREFYIKYVSNMEESFVNEVKKTCCGYTEYDNIPVDKVSSINEMLHLLHSIVVNHEMILQSIPVIDKKTNNSGETITLRGVDTEEAHQIYRDFPESLDVGETDIVCLNNNKILMMIRDKGHALTTEISLNGDEARIEYFIPKICNVEMVNSLPGVNKVKEDSVGATGVIVTNSKYLSNTLIDFISKVPTDEDIICAVR